MEMGGRVMLSGFMRACLGGLRIASVLSSCIVSGERMWEADGRCGWLGRVTKGKGRQHCFFLSFFFICGDLGGGRWRW